MAKTLLPNLDPSGRDGRVSRRAVFEGWRIYREEILPDQEAGTARRAREALVEGVFTNETAGRLGMNVEKLNRLLGQHAPREGMP